MRFSEDRIEKLSCSDGILRDIHIWEPESPRAVFLALHGGMDYGGNFRLPALFFREKGIATLAHDQHGHDLKRKVYIPGFEVYLDDLDLMLEWVKLNYPGTPVFILSHSFGGLIATKYGIERLGEDSLIRGFITSSPYYVNAIKTPKIVEKMAGIVSSIFPKLATPLADILPFLTHDKEVMKRQNEDVRDGIKAEKASAKFAYELLKAQRSIPSIIGDWKHPMLVVVAGDDKVADSEAVRDLLALIHPSNLTELYYPDNFHENFNELNREQIYAKIMEWVDPRI